MVIQKSDVFSAESSQILSAINQHEMEIDEVLKKQGHIRRSLLKEESRFRDVISDELKKMYEEAGWAVKINKGDCQRNGPWHYIEVE